MLGTQESCRASTPFLPGLLAVSTGKLEITLAMLLSGGRTPSSAGNVALKGEKKRQTNEFSKAIFSSH